MYGEFILYFEVARRFKILFIIHEIINHFLQVRGKTFHYCRIRFEYAKEIPGALLAIAKD